MINIADFENIMNNETIFVYLISFIILVTLIYELLSKVKIFPDNKITTIVSFIIAAYVFLTNGYLIMNKLLTYGTFTMVGIFALIIILVVVLRLWRGFRENP